MAKTPEYSDDAKRATAAAYRRERRAGATDHVAYEAAKAAYIDTTGDAGGAAKATSWIIHWAGTEHPAWFWQGVEEHRKAR